MQHTTTHSGYQPVPAQGLYDPRHEHDACGVGFVVHIKGQKTHSIVSQALQLLVNLLHRGACGCEVNTGDGAGILIQMPDRLLQERGRSARDQPAAGARLWRRAGVPAARSGRARAGRDDVRGDRHRRRPARPGMARGPDRRSRARPERGGGRAGVQADLHRARARRAGAGRVDRERCPVRAQAVRDPQADRARGRRGGSSGGREALLLRRQPVLEHVDLQGDADGGPDRGDVPGSDRPGDGVGARAGAPALQHQYISVVAARPPLPFCRSQRRDQHPARQHQLDEGARGAAALGRPRPRARQDPADHPRGRERHGDLRQRPRAAGDGRTIAAARRPDDDSRAVAEPRGDEPGPARVLRVPLVADGAVGRSGVDCLHRRHGDRRRARPQRAAAVALLRHQGRPRHHGVGGRACSTFPPRTSSSRNGCTPGKIFLVDTAQGRIIADEEIKEQLARGVPVRRVAAGAPHRHRGRAGRAVPAAARSPDRAAPAAGVRLYPGRRVAAARADGEGRRRAARVDGHRHAARGAVGAAAPALRLLQAAVRAGHQPAARRDPRRAGDVDGVDDRARAQSAPARARVVPADQRPLSDHRQRPAGQAAAHPGPRPPRRASARSRCR